MTKKAQTAEKSGPPKAALGKWSKKLSGLVKQLEALDAETRSKGLTLPSVGTARSAILSAITRIGNAA